MQNNGDINMTLQPTLHSGTSRLWHYQPILILENSLQQVSITGMTKELMYLSMTQCVYFIRTSPVPSYLDQTDPILWLSMAHKRLRKPYSARYFRSLQLQWNKQTFQVHLKAMRSSTSLISQTIRGLLTLHGQLDA